MDIQTGMQITQKATWACYPYIGKSDQKKADHVATQAMRQAFQQAPISGTVVIGEGERDQAPMLYIGEKVGKGEGYPEMDIAVDPLEGTGLCARGEAGAICVFVISKKGSLLHAPDVYMDKLACGKEAKGHLHIQNSVEKNIKTLSEVLSRPVHQLKVAVLDRPRHQSLIEKLKTLKVQLKLFSDGDVMQALLTSISTTESVDLLLGSGGAPEGVIAAAGLKVLDGDFQGQLLWKNEEQKQRAKSMGIQDVNQIFQRDDLVKHPAVFFATGVTGFPPLLKKVTVSGEKVFFDTLVLQSDQTPHYQVAHHQYTLQQCRQWNHLGNHPENHQENTDV